MKKNNDITAKQISFKVASIISLIVFAITTTAYGVAVYAKLDNRCGNQEIKLSDVVERQNEIQHRVTDSEMNYIEIRTKLANIEAMLLELKKDWADSDYR